MFANGEHKPSFRIVIVVKAAEFLTSRPGTMIGLSISKCSIDFPSLRTAMMCFPSPSRKENAKRYELGLEFRQFFIEKTVLPARVTIGARLAFNGAIRFLFGTIACQSVGSTASDAPFVTAADAEGMTNHSGRGRAKRLWGAIVPVKSICPQKYGSSGNASDHVWEVRYFELIRSHRSKSLSRSRS